MFGEWTRKEVNINAKATHELERQVLDPLWAWSTPLDDKMHLVEATPYADRRKLLDQLGAATCVATDDPRLKEQ